MRFSGSFFLLTIPPIHLVFSSFVSGPRKVSRRPWKMSVDPSLLFDTIALNKEPCETVKQKRIVFLRHGCTYMNEYLGMRPFGSPNFTDDEFSPQELFNYFDAKLSPRGIQQAKALAQRLQQPSEIIENDWVTRARQFFNPVPTSEPLVDWVKELDLIVTSPLTRAIQTCELGILPALSSKEVKIMALPLAAERLYLISDVGRARSDLNEAYGHWIDFETGFRHNHNEPDNSQFWEEWWFGLDDQRETSPFLSYGVTSESYREWRPSSQNQVYACPGEPYEIFEHRMKRLYDWLGQRQERTICVVCHHGVIERMINRSFRNCQYAVVDFTDIEPL
jgi:broad specificity phosphatase PhoE